MHESHWHFLRGMIGSICHTSVALEIFLSPHSHTHVHESLEHQHEHFLTCIADTDMLRQRNRNGPRMTGPGTLNSG